jgi:hypothetical protein
MARATPERSLRMLAERRAVQLTTARLETVRPLIDAGLARVSRTYIEHRNGRDWTCEEIEITDAGRDRLRELERKE